MRLLARLGKALLGRAGVAVCRTSTMGRLLAAERDQEELAHLAVAEWQRLAQLAERSRSQLRQDLFVLHELGFKRGGYFVEFGAADGLAHSNTYLLETDFGWTGILAEPARVWQEALRQNRSCAIDSRCVWNSTGQALEFREAPEPELSSLKRTAELDHHAARRTGAGVHAYQVESVSLRDLLTRHGAPRVVDYLSIDTEGSEYEVLRAFDFEHGAPRVITCEHNGTEQRETIHRLLQGHGYCRKFTGLSQWDDWYIHDSLTSG